MTYAHLAEGRTTEQLEELDEILVNPVMSAEEKAARANARQLRRAGADWLGLEGAPRKPLRPRQQRPEGE